MRKNWLINKIVKFDPTYGLDTKFAWYVGGFTDTGGWHLDLLKQASIKELRQLLIDCRRTKAAVLKRSKEPTKEMGPIIVYETSDGHYFWMSKEDSNSFEKLREDRELRLLGKSNNR